VRRGPDGRPQPLAANVDVAFVITAADGDFSPRRVERLLAVARDGGAEPVVVLAKADLLREREPSIAALRTVADGAPVLLLSARTGEGVDALDAWLSRGRTAVMLGTSGVGKSTLANLLLGEERQATGGLRADGRGRHTTTRRELLALPNGGLLIDAPGIRTVGLWAHEAVTTGFSELDALASGCRFADCRHENEPGCAVVAAIADGRLDATRLAARRQLDSERRWAVERATAAGRAARRARGREGSRYLRRHYRER
jgi:ribosome biogenesis GTPase